MGIIVAGSINMDVVARVKDHPRAGQTIFGQQLYFIPGGKGSNQAVAASRLAKHGAVHLVGKLGQDGFGQTLHEFLKEENIELDGITFSPDTPTGTALIAVNDQSENTIIVIPGSNGELRPADVANVPIMSQDVVVSVFEIPQEVIRALFTRAREYGAKTVLSPAPAAPFIEGLQSLVDVIVLNETELAFFAESAFIPEDLPMIRMFVEQLRAFHEQVFIVTLGGKGAVCVRGDDVTYITGRTVKAIDTTGAGDCFVGALAVALSERKPLRAAVEFANIAASISVQRIGASSSMPHREEVETLLRRA